VVATQIEPQVTAVGMINAVIVGANLGAFPLYKFWLSLCLVRRRLMLRARAGSTCASGALNFVAELA